MLRDRQLRVAEESRFTHVKFLLNGAGDAETKNDDFVMINDKEGMKSRTTLVVGMDVSVVPRREA